MRRANAILDINATDEIELNATLVDINANVEISGTATTTGVHTFTAVPVFPNNTIETADIQADAIDGTKIADNAINSEHYTDGSIDTAHIADGQITTAKLATAVFTGATDIGAAIVDADLFLMDDGAGGTIRKTAASRIKTYAGVSGDVTTIDSLFKTDIKIGEDDQTKIDFETADQINFYAANANQIKLNDGVLAPVTDSDVDLGTSSLYFKDTFLDTIRTTGVAVFGSPTSASMGGYTGQVQLSAANSNMALTINNNQNNDGGVALVLSKSRNTTVGSNTIVADGDVIGTIFWGADDGTNMDSQPANIRVLIDGTPGENDVPGEMRIGTTRDGASNPTDTIFIQADGRVKFTQPIAINNAPGDAVFFIAEAAANAAPMIINNQSSGSSSHGLIFFKRENSTVGSISNTNNATAYNTSSDYRLKENVGYSWDATTRLKQLKPARFSWKVDSKDAADTDGFMAHEVTSIVPQAVTGSKDATKELENVVSDVNGKVIQTNISQAQWTKKKSDELYTAQDSEVLNGTKSAGDVRHSAEYASNTTWAATKTVPDYQEIDQAKLVPLLVKTILELEVRIKTLEDA